MKKKLLTGALALILLAGGLTAAFSVSQSETLVSLGREAPHRNHTL